MPVYEYRCDECDTTHTKVRGISDADPGYLCDTCNFPLTKVYSSIGVTFNGGGFYSTDSRGK